MNDSWTPAMLRYEIRSRIEPEARTYVDTLPFDAPVVIGDILSNVDLIGFAQEDIEQSVEKVLDGMCGEDGSLIRTETGWVKKSAAEIGEICDALSVRYRLDNREWRAGCVLMAILGVIWIITRIWGADFGMRQFPIDMFGLPMSLYDILFLEGLALFSIYGMFRRISNSF